MGKLYRKAMRQPCELMPLSHGVLAELQDLHVLSENAVAG